MANEKTKKVLDFSIITPELWNILSEEEKILIADSLKIKEYKKNELVYAEGEHPQYLMCVLQGKVKIYKNGVGGRAQIIRMVKPMEFLGYRAYFAESNHESSAAAFEVSELCLIPMSIIQRITEQNTRVGLFFIKLLSTDLGISDQRIVNLTQKHLRGRLAESLVFLLDNYGLEEDGATLSIYLSREDIANLSNMTTSNAIRTLSNFVNEQIITMDGRKIKVIDEQNLRKISLLG